MSALLAVAGFVTVAAITPGPNNFIVMDAAARGGFAAAVPAILGVMAGSLVLLMLIWAGAGPVGIVREKSITLPERQNRKSSPLIFLDFSGSIRAARQLPQVFRILL